ncbi:MAG: 3-deoxy-manno-octulosonate cytidylyltransferase [Candidatus Aminicenantes bacterium]|nr:3-deoxy-manno-octulosonate cytidylyltransferase [Candidatus Aminicenantes bacterium]
MSLDVKRAAGIIPARFESTRFPGKPLHPILGKPMIQRVYEGARTARLLSRVIVATDDARIFAAVESFGGEAVMTSSHHPSGTERVAEAALGVEEPIVVNIQGDEPLIEGGLIDGLVEALQDESVPMASVMVRTSELNLIHDRNVVKVVVDKNGFALYFSRAPIPYDPAAHFLRHIGIYGYQKSFLNGFASLGPTRLEQDEKLEQLRVLENGYRIKMVETAYATLSVDVPGDIIKVEAALRKRMHG